MGERLLGVSGVCLLNAAVCGVVLDEFQQGFEQFAAKLLVKRGGERAVDLHLFAARRHMDELGLKVLEFGAA